MKLIKHHEIVVKHCKTLKAPMTATISTWCGISDNLANVALVKLCRCVTELPILVNCDKGIFSRPVSSD